LFYWIYWLLEIWEFIWRWNRLDVLIFPIDDWMSIEVLDWFLVWILGRCWLSLKLELNDGFWMPRFLVEDLNGYCNPFSSCGIILGVWLVVWVHLGCGYWLVKILIWSNFDVLILMSVLMEFKSDLDWYSNDRWLMIIW
jgi:hypothetical protein